LPVFIRPRFRGRFDNEDEDENDPEDDGFQCEFGFA
jgi:hypothetical protein